MSEYWAQLPCVHGVDRNLVRDAVCPQRADQRCPRHVLTEYLGSREPHPVKTVEEMNEMIQELWVKMPEEPAVSHLRYLYNYYQTYRAKYYGAELDLTL